MTEKKAGDFGFETCPDQGSCIKISDPPSPPKGGFGGRRGTEFKVQSSPRESPDSSGTMWTVLPFGES